MSYSITNVNADLGSILHGTNTNQINNLFGLYNRAARQLLLDIDAQETKRITQFITPVYAPPIFDYALPVDLKGNAIADIFPQTPRSSRDIFLQDYNQAFDVIKSWTGQDQFTIIFNTGVKSIRVAAPTLQPPIQVNQASNNNSNGTWVLGGGASGLTTDSINYFVGGGSLEFNLLAGFASGYLENSTMTPVNLTAQLNQATNFLYTYLPTASSVSSVEYRFGSSAANYFSLTTSVTQQNTVFQNGWNLLQFPWQNMAVVGAPDASKISYIRVTWNYNSTLQTAMRLNDILCSMGTILNIEYYSKFLFRDFITGAWQETVTDNSNLVNLDTDSYNIFLNQVAYLAVQQTQGLDALFFDANYFLQLYQEGVKRYKSMYKSEKQLPQSTYYRQPNPSYSQWSGRARWGY